MGKLKVLVNCSTRKDPSIMAFGQMTCSMGWVLKSGPMGPSIREITSRESSKVRVFLRGPMAIDTLANSLRTTFLARETKLGLMDAHTKAVGNRI